MGANSFIAAFWGGTQSRVHFARLDERMVELATAQKTTEESLNAFINVIERRITGPDHAARP